MIVQSRAGITYIFDKSMRYWFKIEYPERPRGDYMKSYTSYSKILATANLGFWSEE